jgi:negative regulator of sigma E activity
MMKVSSKAARIGATTVVAGVAAVTAAGVAFNAAGASTSDATPTATTQIQPTRDGTPTTGSTDGSQEYPGYSDDSHGDDYGAYANSTRTRSRTRSRTRTRS